jgi:hypothetical protein
MIQVPCYNATVFKQPKCVLSHMSILCILDIYGTYLKSSHGAEQQDLQVDTISDALAVYSSIHWGLRSGGEL